MSRPGRQPESLVALLRERAGEALGLPEGSAYTFLDDAGEEAARLSFAELDRRARAIGAALAGRLGGARGERALLLFPPGLAFVEAFLGCLYAGAVAVPAYPPRSNRTLSRLLAIARDARPAVALTTAEALPRIAGLSAEVPGLAALPLLATDTVPSEEADGWQDPGAGPDTLAFLQYTSGSTADPKGVLVTHGNLLHNEEMIRRAFGQSAESVIVGWLPLYHDMGLIGNVLQPLYLGARCVLMSPVAFLQRPERWLAAISRYRATTSGGPNFAYDLCVRRIGEAERAAFDLSSWSVAFNGAEPVRAETLERFARAFGPSGFRREAFYPCYGLAEATLFVSGGEPGSGAVTAELDPAALERDEARVVGSGEGGRALVGCGRAWMGQEVAVVDRATGERCADGRVGEVWVAGPSVAAGYWRREEATAGTFRGFLPDASGPFLRTGDLGFLQAGELWVTGRLKDLIILRGRNLYPQDVELSAERSHPALRPGCSAAFAVEVPGESEERLALVLEIDRHREDEGEGAIEAVRRAIAEEHEAQVHEVVLVRAGSIPKTSSGKIQRAACRKALLGGELKVVAGGTVAPGEEIPGSGAEGADAFRVRGGEGLERAALAALPAAERRPALVEWLRGRAAAALRIDAARISPDRPLTEMGLDSLAAVELRNAAEESFGEAPSLAELLDGASLTQIAFQMLDGTLAAGLGRDDGSGAAGHGEAVPLVHVEGVSEGPLSYGQRALFYLESLAPESAAYLIAGAARVRGGLDPAALRRTLAALSARHPALRTTVGVDGRGEPLQRVHERLDPEVVEEDASGWSADQLTRRLAEVAWQPFDLGRGPLVRLALLRGAEGGPGVTRGDLLVLAIHHLIADFWSIEVLLGDLAALYRSEASGAVAGQDLPPLPFSYLDFVRRQEATLAGLRGQRLWEFWRDELGDRLPVLELPTDRPRPRAQSFRGGAVSLRLSPAASAALVATTRANGATPFMALLAGFQALLARWSGQKELLVGAPTAGRDHAGLAGLIGYFVNPVVLRGDLSGNPSGADLLVRTRQRALAAFAHQDFPFPLLAERLQPVRDPGRSPVFQAMCALQRAHRPGLASLAGFALGEVGGAVDLGGLALTSAALPAPAAQFDLSLIAAELDGGEGGSAGIGGSLQYAADLFDPPTAGRLAAHLVRLLEGLATDPGRPVAELPLLAPAELAEVLAAVVPLAGPPEDVVLAVSRQAAAQPEAPAVVAADGAVLSYGDLDRRAGRLASLLRARGVGLEVPVGICLEHVPERVIAILAVLRAGGAYLSLDPTHPPARLVLQLRDAGVPLVLADGALAPALAASGAAVLAPDSLDGEPDAGVEPVEPPLDPAQLAYLIYTSGSTGTPKASALTRGGLAHLVAWHLSAYPLGPGDRATQLAGPAFDASVWELWPALAAGAELHLVPRDEVADPARLAVRLVDRGITSCFLPTPVAELFFADRLPWPAGLRHLSVGGDRLHRRPPAGLAARVVNCYGPSEATVVSTAGDVAAEGGALSPITIGRPLPGTCARVLDRHLQPLPVGAPGELYVGGALLGRGYLGRPDLTATAFLPDPFAAGPGERLYRTGDRARLLPEGELDCLGRIDQQVKVRGVRIELGEVEAALAAHPAVRQAAALVRDDAGGGRSLAGFAVVDPARAPAEAELRAWLRERLPEAMVPVRLLLLPSLPLTANGKPDRQALAALAAEPGAPEADFVPPGTAIEEQLAALWREVLGAERAGIHDDFFAAGGHSLLVGRLLSRVRADFGVDVSPQAFLEAPTIAGLGQALARALMAEEDADDLAELLAEMEAGGPA